MSEIKEKVLIADDELPIIEGLKALLEDEGYPINTAVDGNEALEKLKDDAYSLLLVD